MAAARQMVAPNPSAKGVPNKFATAPASMLPTGIIMPGFPFLAGLPQQLRVPRLESPRTKVTAGSVAIANAQAGIYPLESPGGWNVLGRTPLRLFRVNESPPTLLRPGDCVRFRRITRDEFEAAER